MKCHFCGKTALDGDTIFIDSSLPACKKCLNDWITDPDLIYDKLAVRYCKGLGRPLNEFRG